MKFYYLAFFVVLFFFTSSVSGSIDVSIPDHYIVRFDANHPERVQVEATLQLSDSLLYMSPNGPMPERWPQYIQHFKVSTKNGEAIELNLPDSTQWILSNTQAGQIVHLSYELLVEHEKERWPGGIDGVAFVRDWGVMVSGRSLFVMNGEEKKDIKVTIDVPDNWRISVPWKVSGDALDTYCVSNQEKLQESFLFAGTHKEINISREGFNLIFVLGGDAIKANAAQYIEMAGKVLDYYIELMGGTPKPRPGNELSQVMVMIHESEQVDGEVIGNHISMLINPHAGMQEQLMGWFMFAHEFFHLWNGKTLRFDGTQSDWFKEGITNYYTIKGLNQVGFMNEEATKMMLNHLFYQRYINDSGYGTLSPSEAASGFDKDNHWGIVYGAGLFAGLCMDMEIRKNSQNSKSLDDVMRYFYQEYGGADQTISNQNILEQVNKFGRTDFSGFLKRHIQGAEPVPLDSYMEHAGIQVDTSEKQLVLTHMEEKTALQQKIWEGFLGKY